MNKELFTVSMIEVIFRTQMHAFATLACQIAIVITIGLTPNQRVL